MRGLSRRGALGLGAAGLGSLFLPSLSKTVRAQETNDKRKILFIYADAGWTVPHMLMRPPWAPAEWSTYNPWDPAFAVKPDELEWEFDLNDSRLTENDFSRVLKPFYRHRDKMIMTEGLAMLSTGLDKNGDGHAKAHLGCMSATPSVGAADGVKSKGSTPSIDQMINEHIRKTNPDHDSLNYRLWKEESFHEYLYRSDGSGGAVRLPTEWDPNAAFTRLFANAGGAPSGGGDPLDTGKGFAFANALAQFDRMTPRLAREDRQKLESHRQMLSELQRRLGRTVSCDAPSAPVATGGMSRGEAYKANIDSFATMIATAFGCGLTRVASMGFLGVPPEEYGVPPEASIHHEYEHVSSPFAPLFNMDGNPTEEWKNAEEGMVRRNIWQAEQVAKIVDILAAVPDGSGSLLDSTLVVYLSELSHGNHGHEHYPIIMFGNLDGAVTPGRYIKYKQANPNPYDRNYMNQYTGTPHSHLFISILQSFGLDIDFLGAESVRGSVPDKNFVAQVSLTGPLPRLKV